MSTIRVLNSEELAFKARLRQLGIIEPDRSFVLTPEHAVITCGDGNHALDITRRLEMLQPERDCLERSFFRLSGPGFPLMLHPDCPINEKIHAYDFIRAMLEVIIDKLGYTKIVCKPHWLCGMAALHGISLPASIEWVVRGLDHITHTFPSVTEVSALIHFCAPSDTSTEVARSSYQLVSDAWDHHRPTLLLAL